MTQVYLYRQIAERIRQDIFGNVYQPGDRLPSVREMATQWNCTIGTVQRAYDTLTEQGLVVSRPGQGTHVADSPPVARLEPLRWATLIHRTEAFLLEQFTGGYTQAELEQAVRTALDRWRTLQKEVPFGVPDTLRFVGSHDPAISLLTGQFAEVAPNNTLQLTFSGSLGGLMALAEGRADLAGVHLWDAESNSYNLPFVQRLLPGRPVVLLTLAHRRLGLVTLPDNPVTIRGLQDLTKSGVRYINRQQGAGTRVWLDAQLRQLAIDPTAIFGYQNEVQTHSEVAAAITSEQANVGLAIESTARSYGLSFIPLTTEQYDLVIPAATWQTRPVQALAGWLATPAARQEIAALGGYDVSETGRVLWLNQ
jgi:molybdate-binding protein/DNA-binding transcriptional regulator YhcF (GntR family)